MNMWVGNEIGTFIMSDIIWGMDTWRMGMRHAHLEHNTIWGMDIGGGDET
jgi:hypothetical protein